MELRLRIAVADDEPDMREYFQKILPRLGHEVVSIAETGLQLVEHCRAMNPELVITDILMPKQEGLETIRQIREAFPNCKIIAMSGGSQLTAMDFLPIAQKFGAAKIFHKPIDFNEMVEAVKELLPLQE